MVQKLREILLTRYIGSILVALLCWQALVVVIERVVQTLFWVINDQRGPPPLTPVNGEDEPSTEQPEQS